MLDVIANNASVINFALINVALGLSIYLTLATGLLSLANAGFMAIGAYTAAILASQAGLPLAVSFVVAIVVAGLIAFPFGLAVLRLRDVYLAIATLGFVQIVNVLALNGDKVLRGLTGDPQLAVFRGAEGITLPYVAPQPILGLPETTWPLLLYVAALATILAILRRSHEGRVLAAVRLDESAAGTLGIDVVRYKLLAFVLGAMMAAGAGVLSAPVVRVIDPRNYGFSRAVDILAYAVLGGVAHWTGPIVGATVLTLLPETLRFLQEQRDVVNGLIIMVSIIFLPRGLADPRFWGGLFRRGRPGAASASPGTPLRGRSGHAAPADDASAAPLGDRGSP